MKAFVAYMNVACWLKISIRFPTNLYFSLLEHNIEVYCPLNRYESKNNLKLSLYKAIALSLESLEAKLFNLPIKNARKDETLHIVCVTSRSEINIFEHLLFSKIRHQVTVTRCLMR